MSSSHSSIIDPITATKAAITRPENPQSNNYINSAGKGPLCSLVDKAIESQIGRLFKYLIPQPTKTLSSTYRVLATADNGLCAVRALMETNEGQHLSAAWTEFVMSLLALTSLVLSMIFDKIEDYQEIPLENTPKTLSSRICKILLTVGKKKCIKDSTLENKEQGTSEMRIFVYARFVVTFMFHAMMCLFSGLLRFNGPGKDYAVPIVETLVGWMPLSLVDNVKATDGPIRVLKKWMKGDNDSMADGDKTE